MDALPAFVLALALRGSTSKEELRFAYAREQEGEGSCGLAVAASLLGLYCSASADRAADETGLGRRLGAARGGGPGERDLSMADIAFLLRGEGLDPRAYRMDLGQLERALDAGFAPLVAHYDRPEGHFVLLLGRAAAPDGGSYLCVADPARGLEALSEEDFLGRWSGALLLVDPAVLGPEGRGRLAAALAGCDARLAILERGRAARAALGAAARAGDASDALGDASRGRR